MSQLSSQPTYQAGFTTVEVLLTIIVGTIFILALYMLSISVVASSANDRNRANASDLAYTYLRKYASAGTTPTSWTTPFVCSTATGSSNTNDLSVNSNATGQTIESGSLTTGINNLPLPVSYKVVAVAPYGCSGANVKKPVKLDAQITYGPNSRVIKHSTYVGYY